MVTWLLLSNHTATFDTLIDTERSDIKLKYTNEKPKKQQHLLIVVMTQGEPVLPPHDSGRNVAFGFTRQHSILAHVSRHYRAALLDHRRHCGSGRVPINSQYPGVFIYTTKVSSYRIYMGPNVFYSTYFSFLYIV